MYHSVGSLCLFVCLFSSSYFLFFSFLVPSSASSGLNRSPNRRSMVTAISVLEFSKQHSCLLKYTKSQSLQNFMIVREMQTIIIVVSYGMSSEPLNQVKSVERLGEKTVVNEGMCSYGLNVF